MATCKVVKGEKGYVPVKSNSHGGSDLFMINNDEIVDWLTNIPMEEGYVQLKKQLLWVTSPTNEYWIEKSHLELVAPVVAGEKYQLLGVDYSVVPPVVTLKKLG